MSGPNYRVEKSKEIVISPSDRVILVLGNTGVGKSTFIQHLTGQDTGIGKNLHSQTAVVSLFPYIHKGRKVVMVDTPGLDDSKRPDAIVLAAVASWLAASYSHRIIPEAILYLHRISDPRMAGSALKRLQIYMRLLGEEAMSNTTFVTTDWPHPNEEKYADAQHREAQLRDDPNYLAPYILQGAKLKRFYGDKASADQVMSDAWRKDRIPLQIQKELVDENLGLQVTQAGKLVAASVEEMIGFYTLTITDLQSTIRRLKDAKDRSSVERRRDAEERLESYESILANTRRDKKVLATNFWKKLARSIRRVFSLSVE